MTPRNSLIIVILGFMASGIFVLFFSYPVSGPDSVQYDRLGYNLSQGHGFSLSENAPYEPTMFREPGYPAFLAAIYLLFGHNIPAVLIAQMLLHAATAMLTYYIARGIFSERAAFFSGIAVAVFPTLANMTAYLLSETLFTFALCLGILAYSRALKKGSVLGFAVSGIVFGAMALIKASSLFLPVVFVVMTIIATVMKRRPWVRAIACMAVFLAVMSIVVCGWVARNKAVFNIPSITLRGGEALWSRAQKIDDSPKTILATACYSFSEYLGSRIFPGAAERPERYLYRDLDRADAMRAQHRKAGLTDARIDDTFKKEATEKISNHPFKYGIYTFVEAIKLTAFTYIPVLNEASLRDRFTRSKAGGLLFSVVKGAARLMAYPLIILFLAGIAMNLKEWDKWIFIVSTAVYFNLVYALLDAIGRFAVPLIPLYCIMGAAAVFPLSRAAMKT